MDNQSYTPPLDKLLAMGEPRGILLDFNWPNYLEFGINEAHTQALIRMVTDEALNQADTNSPEVWAPLHAWRALGQLHAEAAIEPLLKLFEMDDDYSASELPKVYGMIGPAALPALTVFLADQTKDEFARAYAAEAIEEIGKRYPEARSQCVSIISHQLESFAEQNESLNALLISSLLGLEARESAEVIKRAFAAHRVDEMVAGDVEDVLFDLGVGELSAEKQRKRTEFEALLHGIESVKATPVHSSMPDKLFAPTTGFSFTHKKRNKNKRKQTKKSRKQNRRRG